MRWIIGAVAVVMLAALGYEAFRPATRPPVAEGVVQPTAPTGPDTGEITGQAPLSVPDQTVVSERTQAVTEQVARKAEQVAADAARRMQESADRVASAAEDVARTRTNLEIDDTDLGRGVAAAVDGIMSTLGGITDQASAAAAVPKLVAIDARLYQLGPKIDKLPDDARETLASLVTGMLPKVQGAIDRVEATPGASELVRPALDPILVKLDDWSREPA